MNSILESAVFLSASGSPRAEDLRALLDSAAASVHRAHNSDSAAELLREVSADAVFVELAEDGLDVSDGMEVLRRLRSDRVRTPVIFCDENPETDRAVSLIREGAYDYLDRDLDNGLLRRLTERLQAQARASEPGDNGRLFCEHCPPAVEIVGVSDAIKQALETIRLVAESRCNPVLICGETGTGKELAAQAVHAWRCGPDKPFVAVNCATLNTSLLESELFGHRRGAFTGADRDKQGLFKAACDGTIFLDEISEMPIELQAKLLRVLQERTFRQVGGTEDIACRATIVASSNRELLAEVRDGKFRKDLYYRLAVFPITLPPLRDHRRRADITLLAEHFAASLDVRPGQKAKTLSDAARRMLVRHDWPGNVRELRNVIERALVLERSDKITAESLHILGMEDHESDEGMYLKDVDPQAQLETFSLKAAERELILRALRETSWHRTKAATLLGITRATLHAKLKRYDIQPPESDRQSDLAEAQSVPA